VSYIVKQMTWIKTAIKTILPFRQMSGWWRISRRLSRLKALEIGGPSPYFHPGQLCPVYTILSSIDYCNAIPAEQRTQYITPPFKEGTTYLCDSTVLKPIKNKAYDVVLSSHMLEHVANPLKAVLEWKRVLSDKGYILLVLPYKKNIFDHRRRTTSFQHLLKDYQTCVEEDDLNHLEEILQLHDLTRDPLAGSFEDFKSRCLRNQELRFLHHHVFDLALGKKALEWAGARVLMSETIDAYSFLLLAQIQDSEGKF